jgi:hypothetical protein
MTRSRKQQIKHYLTTGKTDDLAIGWSGDWITSERNRNREMKEALVAEVRRRAEGLLAPKVPISDFHSFTRGKVAPMVNGLFPETERAKVLDMLEKSVVFLTADSIEDILLHSSWLHTAWSLANMYLLSIDAELFSKKAPRIVGLSEETNCYVSHEYFNEEDRFADFVVHEAAHVFHNGKRAAVGLPETRKREFLLNIDFHERETFAYACEVYSRILELADNRKDRIKLVAEVEEEFQPSCGKVDLAKFRLAVATAAEAKNGWKKILDICAPVKRAAGVSMNPPYSIARSD